MRKFIDILSEAPIAAISHHGDWSPGSANDNSSFEHEQDRKLLTNPKAVAKMQRMWKYPTDIACNVLLVNNPEANHLHAEGDIGEVGQAQTWLTKTIPETAKSLCPMLRPDQVNIIYTNNLGADRVPMTGWILAHRFGHALFSQGSSPYFNDAADLLERQVAYLATQYGLNVRALKHGYDALRSAATRTLMQTICTFRSAREENLRNSFEALYELFAQYIFTGRIRFNPLPREVRVARKAYPYRGTDYDRDNASTVDDLATKLIGFFDEAVRQAVGHTLVM